MWIDKYRLDQTNLAEGLMCLPVFLAGCNCRWCWLEVRILGGCGA